MRLTLDNQKSYDISGMFKPVKLNREEAKGIILSNFAGWKKGLRLPFDYPFTVKGFLSWICVFFCYSLSLFILPVLWCFGYSVLAYSMFTKSHEEKLKAYRQDLDRIYKELADIEDSVEYQARLKEEVDKVKPF